MIAFKCSRCEHSLTRHDSEAGTQVACPSCGQMLRVPLAGHGKNRSSEAEPAFDAGDFLLQADRTQSAHMPTGTPRRQSPPVGQFPKTSRVRQQIREIVELHDEHDKASKKGVTIGLGCCLGLVAALVGIWMWSTLFLETDAAITGQLRFTYDLDRLEKRAKQKIPFEEMDRLYPHLPLEERNKLAQEKHDEAVKEWSHALGKHYVEQQQITTRRWIVGCSLGLFFFALPLAVLWWRQRIRMAAAARAVETAISQIRGEHPDLVRSWGGKDALANRARAKQVLVLLGQEE